jgi:hypothetical protein
VPWQDEQRGAAITRARRWCEAPGCTKRGDAWHHLFGRRNIIGEPLASWAPFTVWLCQIPHHRAMHEEPDIQLIDTLRFRGLDLGIVQLNVASVVMDDSVEWARFIERKLVAAHARDELEAVLRGEMPCLAVLTEVA